MDKIAIISDIHGNLVALKSVLDDINARGIDRIYCLGDLVAKGAEPKQSLELIRKTCQVVIKGNCDDVIARNFDTEEHIWNRIQIGEDNIKYLDNLPFSYDFLLSGLKVRLIHSSPNDLYESIDYYNVNENVNDEIQNMFKFEDDYNPDIVIFGHIHSPFIYRQSEKMLLNPGAVSNGCDIMEKNGKKYNLSSYMILEGNLGSVDADVISYEIVKIPYNYEQEVENLRNSNMPNKEMAIEELEKGVYVKR